MVIMQKAGTKYMQSKVVGNFVSVGKEIRNRDYHNSKYSGNISEHHPKAFSPRKDSWKFQVCPGENILSHTDQHFGPRDKKKIYKK